MKLDKQLLARPRLSAGIALFSCVWVAFAAWLGMYWLAGTWCLCVVAWSYSWWLARRIVKNDALIEQYRARRGNSQEES